MMLNPDIRPIASYFHAKSRFDSIKPWRGSRDTDARPLDKSRAKRHVNIRIRNDDAVACCYHNTDVVVYYPDDTVELGAWCSPSTDRFANTILPNNIFTRFNGSPAYVMLGGDQSTRWGDDVPCYRIDGTCKIKLGDTPTWLSPITPWEQHVINRKEASAALKRYKFRDFQHWLTAVTALENQTPSEEPIYRHLNEHELVEALADRAKWHETFMRNARFRSTVGFGHSRYKARVNAPLIENAVREAVYQKEQVGTCIEHDVAMGWRQAKTWTASTSKYWWVK
jgi:hypothetical protein